MNLTRRSLLQATASSPLLFMTGCSSSGLITALDVAEVAATAAIPVITAFGAQLGPFEPMAIAYAKGIGNACALSITELGNTADSQAVQYSKIAGYFAQVAALSLPAGAVDEVVAVIAAIGGAVQAIMSIIGKPAVTPTLSAPNPRAQLLLKQYRSQVKALGSDSARIKDVMTRASGIK